MKRILDDLDEGKIELSQYKCVYTNATSGEEIIVDDRWCILKYKKHFVKYKGQSLGVNKFNVHKPGTNFVNNSRRLLNYNTIDLNGRRHLGLFDFFNAIGDFFEEVGDFIESGWQAIEDGLDEIGRAIVAAVEWVADIVKSIPDVQKLIDAVENFVKFVQNLMSGLVEETYEMGYRAHDIS